MVTFGSAQKGLKAHYQRHVFFFGHGVRLSEDKGCIFYFLAWVIKVLVSSVPVKVVLWAGVGEGGSPSHSLTFNQNRLPLVSPVYFALVSKPSKTFHHAAFSCALIQIPVAELKLPKKFSVNLQSCIQCVQHKCTHRV